MGASPSLMWAALGGPALLLIGWLMGELARRVVRRRALVTGATMTVVSVLGLSLGLALVGLTLPHLKLWSPITVAGAFFVDVAVLALVSAIVLSRQARESLPIADVVAGGESEWVEFKSTARINLHTGQRDDRMELVIAKTVAAFLNADGGALIVGVDDQGTALGLAADYATLKQADADRFELWLRDLLQARLGIAAAQQVRVDFAEFGPDGLQVCRLTCPAAAHPVFLRAGKSGSAAEIWVRVGNSTRALDLADAIPYVQRRFGARGSTRRTTRRRAISTLALQQRGSSASAP